MSNTPGPTVATQEKLAQVWKLLAEGNKLDWSLRLVGLSSCAWYRWAGWQRQPVGRYLRKVHCRPEAVERQMRRVEKVMSEEGLSARKACERVGMNPNTYFSRRWLAARRAAA